MDWQQLVSLAIVLATVVVLLWSRFRRRKFNVERSASCGCGCAASHPAPQSSILLRARKGERPEMIIKLR